MATGKDNGKKPKREKGGRKKGAAVRGYYVRQELNKAAGQKNPSWCVEVVYRGIRRKKRFRTKEEGEAWGRAQVKEIQEEGTQAEYLGQGEKRDAIEARKILGVAESGESLRDAARELSEMRELLGGRGRGMVGAVEELAAALRTLHGRASLAEAVAFWAVHHPDGNGVTLAQLSADFIREQERRGNSPKHVQTLVQRLRSLRDAFGDERAVASIMAGDLKDFLENREGLSSASRNAWMVTMKSAFKFAAEEYGLGVNPAERLKKEKVARGVPEFMPVANVEKVLRAAEEVAPDFAAAVAILFFAGVRPVELSGQYGRRKEDGEASGIILGGLAWEDVNPQTGFIRLTEKVTKTTQLRLVPISENLLAWLAAYGGKESGRIISNPQAWRTARERIVAAAGVDWGQDYARHSFATYHLALHGDRAALERAMGHGETSTMLENNYRGLATREDAVKFWAIMPRKRGGQMRKGR